MPTDVLVVGAGPGGCATALALARQGREVMLVGIREAVDRKLSGEWLHPAGVAVMRRLGIELSGDDVVENHGFVLHPGNGGAAVALPYPHGVAVTMRHHLLVERLRQEVREQAGVTLVLGDRVTEVTGEGWAVTSAGTIRSGMIVGAEGRASGTRRVLCPAEPLPALLSVTAGFELSGVCLPEEGYGHVFLDGPGPILAYRIGPDTVRLSLDVAPRRAPATELLNYLQHAYAPVLPKDLRAAFHRAATHGPPVRWAANRVRLRRFYGRDRLALVGDAVGFGHPLSALGLTAAVLDAECLARWGQVAGYARERRTKAWTSERVGVALHRALTGTDIASVTLREALFRLWRGSGLERDRMMRLLAVQEDSRKEFGLAIAHIVASALHHLGESTSELPLRRSLERKCRIGVDLAAWLLWLCGPTSGVPPTPE